MNSETVYSLLRAETVGDDGIVPEFQSEIRFGFSLTGAPVDAPACPNLVTVDPALDNHAGIEAVFPPESGSSAQDPLVYYGLKHVLERVQAANDPVVRRSHAIIVFVRQQSEALCLPELVEFGWPARATNAVASEADDGLLEDLSDLGVRTYVFSSNIFDDASVMQRLNRMAELGASGHGPFLIGDGDALGNALREITSSLVSCEVSLQGKVTEGRECTGEVTINGEAVPCNDPNGWRLTGPSSLEFVGDACDALQEQPNGRVRASFPCDVVTLI